MAIFLFGFQTSALKVTPYVVAASADFPPDNSAWVGALPHQFLDGQVTLFCGTHGIVSGSGEPLPAKSGERMEVQYPAIFTGELTLNNTADRRAGSYQIDDPIRMTERITSRRTSGATQSYATELTAITFEGSDFPDHVSVRESPRRRSVGNIVISIDRDGSSRIQSSYQVWLEITLDGGKSWHLASEAVTMNLVPVAKPATVTSPKIHNKATD